MKRYRLEIVPAVSTELRHKMEGLLTDNGYAIYGSGAFTDMSACDISFGVKKEGDKRISLEGISYSENIYTGQAGVHGQHIFHNREIIGWLRTSHASSYLPISESFQFTTLASEERLEGYNWGEDETEGYSRVFFTNIEDFIEGYNRIEGLG